MGDAVGNDRLARKAWGVEMLGAGQARFRLWAPQAQTVLLRVAGWDAPMDRSEDGWFEHVAEGVEPGQRYSFVLADGRSVPDPASRAQESDVHGPSVVTDPSGYGWRNAAWQGRPWREAVIYEMHVGTFTPEGTFRAAAGRLAHLARLGVTVLELMPVGQFAGARGWGYDGVLPYAPHSAYGTPDDLKFLVDEAHGHGIMVMLDVVYNHFGPDGNYLPTYAADFFDEARHTPWGAAIAYQRRPVRDFFIDNALCWIGDFKFDGLRLDAVDQISDPSEPELLVELAERVRAAFPGRHVHLTTEDNRNITRLHERQEGRALRYTGEWNDDFHNAAHVLLTGEVEGYYEDFAGDPLRMLARCLAEGFAYQGEPSPHDGGKPRGMPSSHLPATAFVNFLQNHDQVGNRALGERLTVLAEPRRLRALTGILLLSPHVPMLFMGEEWDETRPFYFFTDFHGDLADAVREGRRREFARFSAFDSREDREAIPDPNDEESFLACKIDWNALERPEGRAASDRYAALLALRRDRIVPLLDDGTPLPATILRADDGVLAIDWRTAGGRLQLRANLADGDRPVPGVDGEVIYATDGSEEGGRLAPGHVIMAIGS